MVKIDLNKLTPIGKNELWILKGKITEKIENNRGNKNNSLKLWFQIVKLYEHTQNLSIYMK